MVMPLHSSADKSIPKTFSIFYPLLSREAGEGRGCSKSSAAWARLLTGAMLYGILNLAMGKPSRAAERDRPLFYGRMRTMIREIRIACITALCLAGIASAEAPNKQRNLWISHHYAGIENYYTGDYNDAAHLFEAAALDAHRKYRSADTHGGLGRACTALGKFDEAETHYRDALAMKRSSLGKNHPFNASSLNDLADLLYLLERTDESASLYREALEIMERDEVNLEVARSLNGLALIAHDAGDNVAAEEMLKRALNIHDKGLRRDHPYTATVLTNLGILYTHLARYEEAKPAFTRASYIQGVKLHDGHPDVAVRMHAEAFLQLALTNRGEAARLATDADAIRDNQAAKGDLY